MEKYYAKKSIQTAYRIIGTLCIVFLAVFLIINPFKDSEFGLATRLIYTALTIFLAILHFLRPRRCVLEFREDELYFHDGLLGRTRIPYDLIKSVDYHPDLKFRFTLKKRKTRQAEIPNLFSLTDQDKILKALKRKRKTIEINYLVKPDSLIRHVKSDKDRIEDKR